jgi:4-hydroxybenzoate polyprenyltransferase
VYISAVTAVSRGEVHGGKRLIAGLALISLILVMAVLVGLSAWPQVTPAALLLTTVLAARLVPKYVKVWQRPDPMIIRDAVRTGVLSLVLLDSVLGALYAGPLYGAAILGVGVTAGWLARRFAVT